MSRLGHGEAPGVWRAQDLDAAAPGVHALIIGVSHYPYLLGGEDPAPETAGMRQLLVSASGAAQVFDWLRRTGRFADRPVVSCRLWLAPSQAGPVGGISEAAFVDQISGGWHGDPTMRELAAAIEDWSSEFVRASLPQRPKNAALFFFSGHGLEVLASPSLQAKDFLNWHQADGGRTNAIAYKSILDALPTYGFGDGIFFFDACRNQPDTAKRLNVVGREVLQPAADAADPPRALMHLKSTDALALSYQDPDSERRASMFTHALLEALEGLEPDDRPYDRRTVPWALRFAALEAYAKARVRELLRQKDALKLQSVIPGGDPYDAEMLVADREPPHAAVIAPPPGDAGEGATADAGDEITVVSQPSWEPPLEIQSVLVQSSPETLDDAVGRESTAVLGRFDIAAEPPDPGAVPALRDYGYMQPLFGHETFTNPFIDQVSVQDLQGRPADDNAIRILAGRTSTKDETSWIDLEIEPAPDPGSGLWVSLDADRWRGGGARPQQSLAVLLPRDPTSPLPVRLEIDWRMLRPHAIPVRLTARIGDPSDRTRAIWGPLFEAQRTAALASLSGAAQALTANADYQAELRDKVASPYAAALAAARLIEAGAADQLLEGPRNLARRYPRLAEGPVLWAEALLRRRGLRRAPAYTSRGPRGGAGGELAGWWAHPEVEEAARAFASIDDIGLPLVGPVMALAADQALMWRRRLDAAPAELWAKLKTACELVISAAEQLGEGDVFLSFASTAGRLQPDPIYRRRELPRERVYRM